MITFAFTKPPTKQRIVFLLLMFCCLGTVSILQVKADWPFARGGTDSTGVAETSLPVELVSVWKFTAQDASFEATPVASEGVLYLGDTEGTLYAINLADGKPIWQKTFEKSGFISPAAVDGQTIYVVDIDGIVLALNRIDGTERWRYDSKNEVYSGPIAYDGKLLVTTEAGLCLGLALESGEFLWEFAIDAPLRCAATVVSGHAMLAGCDSKLHAIDLTTGKEVGSVELGSQTGCTAAMRNGNAYFGTEEGSFLAINATDVTSPTIAWTYRDARRGQGIRAAAAVTDKQIVYASQGKAIYCLDRATGTLLWQAAMRSRLEASPIIAGEQVVVCTSRGRIQLINLADGELNWEYDAGGSFLASPIAVDGKLIVTNTDGTLICFGKAE